MPKASYDAVAVALFLAFLTATHAQAENEPPAVDCANAMATVDLNICAEQEFERADQDLNVAYKKVLGDIRGSEQAKPHDPQSWENALRESQRAWVAFRDADCKGLVPMPWGGGTGATGAVLGCMTSMTKSRTEDFLERLDSQ